MIKDLIRVGGTGPQSISLFDNIYREKVIEEGRREFSLTKKQNARNYQRRVLSSMFVGSKDSEQGQNIEMESKEDIKIDFGRVKD